MRNTINLKVAMLAAILVAGLCGTAKAYDPYEEKLKRNFYDNMDRTNAATAKAHSTTDGMARDLTGKPLVSRPAAPRSIAPAAAPRPVAPVHTPSVSASAARSLEITRSKVARDAHNRELMRKALANQSNRR